MEEGRTETGSKKGGKTAAGGRRERGAERHAETRHSGTGASAGDAWTEPSQPGGNGSNQAFIKAPHTQPLIYNRLTANILQVPLGTSEDRKKSERNEVPRELPSKARAPACRPAVWRTSERVCLRLWSGVGEAEPRGSKSGLGWLTRPGPGTCSPVCEGHTRVGNEHVSGWVCLQLQSGPLPAQPNPVQAI